MKLSELYLNRYLYRDNNQDLGTKDSEFVSADSSEVEPGVVPSGGAAQDINTGNVQIDGKQLEPGTYPVTTLDVANWGWGQTCVFSSTDLNTVSWGAGTFTSADGTSYAISAGNTGNMAAKTYIYLSLLDSETVYQTTTNPATAVGLGKVLIAVAENAADNATYMLSEAIQVVGDNILTNSINASKIVTGQLIVGTNVGLGTAEDSAGVTTIIGNTVDTGYITALSLVVGTEIGLGTAEDSAGVTTIIGDTVTTGFVNALNITAKYVVASVSLSSPSIFGGTISIGTGNNVFKVDSGGIYLGNASFASAPFRVNMAGDVTASSLTLTNASIGGGSSYAGNQIASAYIGNLSASKITSGSIIIGGASQPGVLTIIESSSGGAGGTTSLLNWKTSGGTLRGKIWADTTGYMGYNSVTGGRHYFYTQNIENVVIMHGAQTIFNEGISCRGGFNVGIPNSTTEKARFTDGCYFDATTSTAQEIWGGSNQMVYNATSYHYFNINTTEKLKLSTQGAAISNGLLYLPILTGAQASGYASQNGACYYNSDSNTLRMYGNGSWQTVHTF